VSHSKAFPKLFYYLLLKAVLQLASYSLPLPPHLQVKKMCNGDMTWKGGRRGVGWWKFVGGGVSDAREVRIRREIFEELSRGVREDTSTPSC
jgi:hypothetical protein